MSIWKGPHNPWDHREEVLRKHLAEVPDDAEALALLAGAHDVRGQHAEALRLARRAVELDAGNAHAHYVLACALVGPRSLAKGTVVEAIAAIHRAIALDPEDPTFYAQLAYLQYLLGQRSLGWRPYERALEAAEHGLRIDPESAPCTFFRGLVLQRLHRYTEAEAALERAVRLEPDASHIRVLYGQCLVNRGKLSAAIDQWTELVRLEPASRQHRVRLRNALRLMHALEVPLRFALRMGFVRAPSGSRALSRNTADLKMNWLAGLALAITLVGSAQIVGASVGEHSGLHSAVECGLTMGFGALFARSVGWTRIVSAILAAFFAVLWLELSFLFLLTPQYASAAIKSAWPHLRPGPIFYLARIVGIAAAGGMGVFLSAFATLVLRQGSRPRAPQEESKPLASRPRQR